MNLRAGVSLIRDIPLLLLFLLIMGVIGPLLLIELAFRWMFHLPLYPHQKRK